MVRDNCTDTIYGTGLSQAVSLSWRGWLEDGKALAAREMKAAAATVKAWTVRARTRRHLRHLDARLLADVGLTRVQALEEAHKPFWVK